MVCSILYYNSSVLRQSYTGGVMIPSPEKKLLCFVLATQNKKKYRSLWEQNEYSMLIYANVFARLNLEKPGSYYSSTTRLHHSDVILLYQWATISDNSLIYSNLCGRLNLVKPVSYYRSTTRLLHSVITLLYQWATISDIGLIYTNLC